VAKVIGFFVLFTGLIMAAEQSAPWHPVNVEEWTSDYLADAQSGNAQREVAYLLLAAITSLLWVIARPLQGIRIDAKGRLLIGTFLVWAAASSLWSDEPGVLFRRLLTLGIVLAWVYVCTTRWTGETVVLFVLVSSLANITVSTMTDVLHSRFAPLDPGYRLSGTIAPNDLAINALILVLASLAIAGMRRRGRSVLAVCVGVGILVILLTKSRTTLIALGVSVLVVAHLSVREKVKLRVMWLLIFAGVLAIPILTGNGVSDAVAAAIPRSDDKVNSLSGRVPLWQDCIENYVLDRPIRGFGFSTFWTRDRITKVSNDQGWGISAAHSAYIELLLALGLPGLILYLSFVVFSLQAIRRRLAAGGDRHLVFCCSLICGLLVIGITESELPFRSSSIYFYALIAYLLPFINYDTHGLEFVESRSLESQGVPLSLPLQIT
jgi:exopolysaccharide production protein ExoQ